VIRFETVIGLLALIRAGLEFNDSTITPERDYGRTCLALVGFSEARDQPDEGLAAVMQVVVNRANDVAARWPRTLCDVALQPGQFLGVDRWPTPRHPERIDRMAWLRALDMAGRVIAHDGPVPPPCRTATSFDQSPRIAPPDFACRIGAHTFYADPPLAVAAH
jgi:spore germination cell wall hydrolase CwlJ-like protein